MAEEIDPTKLREIDLALVVEAAYNMAARNSDGGNRVLLDMDAQPGQYKARGSNLLIDALVNVFESSMTNAEVQNTIRVEIANSEQSGDGYWDLLILNENRNVDPNHVQDLLERGFEAKSGTGLGLSVTKMLVEAIGGRVTVSTREQNAGLRFSVTLAKV
jgi:signal transduction histidine kinase